MSSMSTISINFTNDFKSDIKSGSSITMFYLKGFDDDMKKGSNLGEFINDSRYIKLATDKIDKYNYLIILSRDFMDPEPNILFEFSKYPKLVFYYKISSVCKEAFTLYNPNSDSTSQHSYDYEIIDFAKNVILIDLSNYEVNFEFNPSYVYNDVPVPVYKHYHKIDKEFDSVGLNAVDSSIYKNNLLLFKEKLNNNYLPNYDNNYPFIKNNVLESDSRNKTTIINKLDNDNQLTNNSNQVVIFDNTELLVDYKVDKSTKELIKSDISQLGDYDYPILNLFGSNINYQDSDDYYILVFYNDSDTYEVLEV